MKIDNKSPYLNRTIKGIQEGRDELLDKALEICR